MENDMETETMNAPIIKTIDVVSDLIPPNNTLYIQNMNEKIKQTELKKQLYSLFSKFGAVLEIVSKVNMKGRGQAFIVFRDLASSIAAAKDLNGFDFLGKPMKIHFAKTKSDAIAKLDGSYIDRKKKYEEKMNQEHKTEKSRKRDDSPPPKKKKVKKEVHGPEPIIPSNLLFIENVPDAIYERQDGSKILEMLFANFPGYKELRLVQGKKGIAFCEYENELQSSTAMNNLQGFKMYEVHLKITFAKK